jgi:peptidoglycan/LPS O-acetylase OafA/YrhL
MTKNFRYDINGLRAYAVALVVLFHFGIFGFSSGFIGVDIFFVISGFLMTSIVVKGLEKGNFSILSFYLSRAIRIVPALFILVSIVLLIGWLFLLPNDYMNLGKHSLSSINFFSNIVYWKESGYFDTNSHNKALLHTWSLAVEWQFYLIFPIFVSLIYRLNKSRKFLASLFIIGIIVSFALSVLITYKSPSAGFFLLPTRAWEMLFGGLVFFLAKNNITYSKITELSGFILIGLSCYLFTQSTPWPSYNALLPVLGTFLILISNNQDSIFTRHLVFQWLGNNSYSIYLWHWPLVFLLYYFNKNDSLFYISVGIVLSIILGWLSFKFIETPTRIYFSSLSKVKAYIVWITSISALTLIALFIFKSKGIPERLPDHIVKIDSLQNDFNPRTDECLSKLEGKEIHPCTYGTGKLSLIVLGDSHANAMLSGVIKSMPNNTSLISFNISGCPAVFDIKRVNLAKYHCGERIREIAKLISKYPNDIPLLIINRSNAIFRGEPENDAADYPIRYVDKPYSSFSPEYISSMQKAYINTLAHFAKSRTVYVTRPTPEAEKEIPSLAARVELYNLSSDALKIPIQKYYTRSQDSIQAQDIAAKEYGIKIIDLTNFFCDQEYCHFVKDGMPLFRDDDHMAWESSTKLSPYFEEIFK